MEHDASDAGEARYELVISVDARRSGQYGDAEKPRMRERIYRILDTAFAQAGVDRRALDTGDSRGRAVLMAVAGRIAVTRLLGLWMVEVHESLREENSSLRVPLGLRIAMHVGPVPPRLHRHQPGGRSVQSDPDSTPARPLFCDDPEADLALSRARSATGAVDVAGVEVTGRLVFYRGGALPAAVLAELWDRHFPVRAPVVRWLRLLADDPRPQVSMRAAVAAGELSVRDFEHGYAELVRPLADAPTPRRRMFAAAALDQAAGHASHRKAVRKVVDDWSRFGTPSLRWTAAMALGYGRSADSMDDTLDALARIGIHDDGKQAAVASQNVVRLLTHPESAAVLRRLAEWTAHRAEEYQDLALVTIVRLALTDVDEVLDDEPGTPLGDRGDWPLLVALAATRPELTGRLADLFWTALNTTRSRDVAFDALETLLRSAFRKDGRPWTREGLAALLPALVAEEHDRRRLDWLLRRMMRDQDRPLPEEQARALWRLAVPAGQRRSDEEENHG
ncbi:hypothetical protein SCALM49S_00776 [Streptomyces californicus]